MTTLGAVCIPQVPPERLREVAQAADDTGLDELWLWEELDSGTTREQFAAAREAIDAGRAAAGRADPHSVVVYPPADPGDTAATAEAVRSWASAGAGTVVLHPTRAGHDRGLDPVAYIRFVAGQIRPLVN